ncbi:inhibitory POU protein isoform X3 [Frankliniella occidentalis]|uniref:POU domain protein n=1 Tax=Frankliniella occidentalis TaxID=133901 RepID=A0A9C6WX30_FRAOC|nr:inhibitory POU protein isoform X3 [Frankliniella occidentalis]
MYSPDKMMNGKGHGPLHPTSIAPTPCFPGRYSPTYRGQDPMRRCVANPSKGSEYLPSVHEDYKSRILEDSIMCNSWSPRHNGDLFSGLNDGLLSRAEALDISKHQGQPIKHDMMYHHAMPPHNPRTHQMGPHGMEGLDRGLDMLEGAGMTTLTPISDNSHHQLHPPPMYNPMNSMMGGHHHHHHHGGPLAGHATHHPHHPHHHPHPSAHHPAMAAAAAAAAGLHPDSDTDPRELEAFAERFKQRRIKLGVTQADVGKALAALKLPGVGALSQSTICRFESLTLSHNNMIALKPILQAWLEEAEAQARSKRQDPDAPSVLPAGEKKRKRTSIAAPEKRSLEAYFNVQPRPSGEKIAAIAEKLDLKKNVVRVWFCNQRQKQKRMKFAAQH